ncbi:MAG: tRNA uridine-5-carboxymethylaminomethyl(34) synthesis GTPase MnmE [Lachnospiraceae bacterium]|nr:tRNA uridine-5-carboxymethylaminomethyl(34) synthesis GTPase MnmE [Lachnospiraceae bacterium]
MRTNDTIAAIATALSPAGIGIVRISGEEAIDIADKIYKGKKSLREAKTHTINYGFVYDGEEIVDQVLVMIMKAPCSYTGENVVEIQCHGGVLVMKRILELAIDAGANIAEPGEFTKRAFLNGKMDLSQAEAVADIIDAESRNSLKVGISQLKGRLSEELRDIRRLILNDIAFIEAALDDPEHYSLDGYAEELETKTARIMTRIERLIRNSEAGIIMKSGIDTVILGRPNSGKSSVLNLLAGTNRAIVTDIAGTTRDTLTENISLAGIKLNLTDTAGLRESTDTVEKIGVERAKKAAKEAELILCVIDGAEDLTDEDIEVLDFIDGMNAIILINKQDVSTWKPCMDKRVTKHPFIGFSAKSGQGLKELETLVRDMFFKGEINLNDEIYITSVRHLQALKAAMESLKLVRKGIESGLTEDLISVDLTDAYEALGTITGETVGEDIINEIFSKFCMGK